MATLVHISDLHFGTEKNNLVELLLEDIPKFKPDFLVITGDLTQRAQHAQYQAVTEFLQLITVPRKICVPGNHDISLYNPVERFLYPFKKYNHYARHYLKTYKDDELAIMGINSVTPYKAMSGFVTESQLGKVLNFFEHTNDKAIRIVAMHHNLVRSQRHQVINDAPQIINILNQARVNLVLSGHIHFACIEQVTSSLTDDQLYVITAGTPTSTRTIAPNSYNVLKLEGHCFKLTVREILNNEFITRSENEYQWRAT